MSRDIESNRMSGEKIIGQVYFSIDLYCPKCEHYFDVLEQDDGGEMQSWFFQIDSSKPEGWDMFEGADVVCSECSHEFKLDGIEY